MVSGYDKTRPFPAMNRDSVPVLSLAYDGN